MKQYEKYKDSKVDWIGETPTHWEVKKGKFIFDFINGYPFDSARFRVNPENGLPLIRIRNINNHSSETYWDGEIIQEALINNDDILIGMDGDFNISKWRGGKALLNQRVCKIVGAETCDNSYLFYLLPFSLKVINDLTYFTTVKHLSNDDLWNESFPLPPKSEQAAIVNFLDEKTSQIDKLISNKQKLIELLKEEKIAIVNNTVTKGINSKTKLKYSGIDWIGDIPNHWNVKRVKHICTVQGRIGFKGYKSSDLVQEGEGALTLGATHITRDHKINITESVFLSWDKYYESPEIMIKQDDVVFTQRGAYLGKVALIDKDYGKVTINPSLILLKEIIINGGYLTFYLTSNYIRKSIELISNNTAIPMISQEQLSNFYCLVPPLSEQEELFSFINSENSRIELTISKVEKEIELMQEYRTALISEVVTGKIKVI